MVVINSADPGSPGEPGDGRCDFQIAALRVVFVWVERVFEWECSVGDCVGMAMASSGVGLVLGGEG